MSRKYIAREVLKRLRLGEPLGEELIRKFIRFLPELYKDSNGYDDFAKLRHDVFSAFRYDHADRLIGFDLGACWGAISEEESVSLDYAQEITSLRINNANLREERERLFQANVEKNGEVLRLVAENTKLRELVTLMYRDMQGVLDMSTDTVWVDDIGTLRDEMDYHMQAMAELGMPPADYERRMRELGIEVRP